MKKAAETQSRLGAAWRAMQPRERVMVALAVGVVALAALWWLGLQPAWKTYKSYPTQRAALERQVQQMQDMRQQALQLQGLMAGAANQGGNSAAGAASVQSSAQTMLGPGTQANVQGDSVTVRFQNVAPGALAQWLRQTREHTRGQAVQLQMTRTQTETSSPTWSGQATWALP